LIRDEKMRQSNVPRSQGRRGFQCGGQEEPREQGQLHALRFAAAAVAVAAAAVAVASVDPLSEQGQEHVS